MTRSKMIFSGQIEIDGHKYNAMSDNESLEPNTPIVVIGLDGMTLMVHRTEEIKNNQENINLEKTNTENIPETIYDPFA
jgi:membrane-bound ClpP family serine protease